MVKIKQEKGIATVGDVMKAREGKEVKPVTASKSDREDFLQRFYDLTEKAIRTYCKTYNAGKAEGKKDIAGIHCKYSGYLSLMANRFGIDQTSVIDTVKELVEQGVLEQRATKGGYVLYLKGEMPVSSTLSLSNMGL